MAEGMKKTVMRIVIYEGDTEWVDFILSKSLPEGRRELGGKGNFIEIRRLKEGAISIRDVEPLPKRPSDHTYIGKALDDIEGKR